MPIPQDSIATTLPHSADSITSHAVEKPHTDAVAATQLQKTAPAAQEVAMPEVFAQQDTTTDSTSQPSYLNEPLTLDNRFIADRAGFFSGSQWVNKDSTVHFTGVSGDLVPYKLSNDVFVTGTMLVCLLLASIVISTSKHALVLQIKTFFRFRGREEDLSLRSERIVNNLPFVVLLESFVISILFFSYTQVLLADTFTTTSPYILLLCNIAICLLYFAIKSIFYKLFNCTFFNEEKREHWLLAYNLVTLAKAILLLPLALVVLYFNLSTEVCIWAFFIVIGLCEMLVFFKTRQIFFTIPFGTLPAILYFCTLELLPFLFLWKMLVKANEYLTI